MQQTDYYAILDIPKDADKKAIRDAYRKLALIYHPDRNQNNDEAAEKMKAVNEAYAVLSDPEKRRQYDSMRSSHGAGAYSQFRQAYSDEDIFRGTDIHSIFEELAKDFGFRGGDAIFKEFYGSGWKTFTVSQPGFTMKGSFFSFGGKKNPEVEGRKGGGKSIGGGAASLLNNLFSGGKKAEQPVAHRGQDIIEEIEIDEKLATSGGPYAYLHKARGKRLVVKIPPGVREGQKIRLSGMGGEGTGGAPAGDLYLKVVFERGLVGKIGNFFSKIASFGSGK